jgi:hypothetical protein
MFRTVDISFSFFLHKKTIRTRTMPGPRADPNNPNVVRVQRTVVYVALTGLALIKQRVARAWAIAVR